MGNPQTESGRKDESAGPDEDRLRGKALDGSEQQSAVDHTAYARKRNPDDVVRVDNEEDTLYNDGLEIGDDTPPMGTNRSP